MANGARFGLTVQTLSLLATLAAAGCGGNAGNSARATAPSATFAPGAEGVDGSLPVVQPGDDTVDFTATTLATTTTEAEAGATLATEPPSGVTCVLPGDLLFAPASADLTSDGVALVERLVAAMGGVEAMTRITIAGHTDARGDTETNLALSQRRAEAVADLFISRGYKGPLDVKGYGETLAQPPDSPPNVLAADRRVDITLEGVSASDCG